MVDIVFMWSFLSLFYQFIYCVFVYMFKGSEIYLRVKVKKKVSPNNIETNKCICFDQTQIKLKLDEKINIY